MKLENLLESKEFIYQVTGVTGLTKKDIESNYLK